VNDRDGLSVGVLPGVRVGEPLADAGEDVQEDRERGALADADTAVEERAQIPAVHVLEGDVVRVVDPAEIERPRDVGVLELRGDPGLVLEHLDELFVLRDLRKDSLERDDEVSLGVPRLEDLRHSPRADALEELVAAKRLRAAAHGSVHRKRGRVQRARRRGAVSLGVLHSGR
jgi:hypothetical protein